MIVFLLTVAASIAALLGGLTALHSRGWLNRALALTAGLVLGLVCFDLLPEIFDLSGSQKLDTAYPMIALAAGFLAFHVFEKFVPIHEANEEQYGPHRHPVFGSARAAALSGHSFLDGLSIGVGFQASTAVGSAVALAVIGHRFADGFDTTTFMVFHGNKIGNIRRWLAIVVLMPILGGLSTLVFDFSQRALAIYLGFFAGFILYIAAGNILPQAHSESSSKKTIGLTILGVILMFIVTRLA
jgi:zinc transporter, ZIP family